jgi:phosphoglucosamine mutase
LARCWKRFPQILENLRVRERRPLEELSDVTAAVQAAEAELQPAGGRILLRYSGTEPKVRLLLEGPDLAVLERWKERILTPLRRQVGG